MAKRSALQTVRCATPFSSFETFYLPSIAWLMIIGRWNYSNMNDGIEGMSMALFTRYLKWSPEEVQVFLCKVREELQDTNIHAFWTM